MLWDLYKIVFQVLDQLFDKLHQLVQVYAFLKIHFHLI